MSKFQPFEGKTVTMFDLIALVQFVTKGKQTTFGHLSDALMSIALNMVTYSDCVHIEDSIRYDTDDSIKSGERARRTLCQTLEIKIKGRETQLPANIKKFLTSNQNKSNLIAFLQAGWIKSLPRNLKENPSVMLHQEKGKAIRIFKKVCHEDCGRTRK